MGFGVYQVSSQVSLFSVVGMFTMKPITEESLEVAREAGLFFLEEEGINPEHFGEEGSGWGSAGSLARTENSTELAAMMVASAENLTEPEALMYFPHHVDDYILMEGSG